MKKLAILIVIVIVSSFINVSAQQTWMLGAEKPTMDIDVAWDYEPFMKNTLPVGQQTIDCGQGGKMRLFVGKETGMDIRMCRIDMPDIIESQTTSLQLVVNGRQQFNCPIKLSYQVFSEPKILGGAIVVHVSTGMYNPSHQHFYVVVRPDGSGYTTDVRSKETK